MSEIRNYTAAFDFLAGGRDKSSRPLGGVHTELHLTGSGLPAVRYHNTDVVTFTPDGGAVLNTGGWFTTTTKVRMNAHLPTGTIYQERMAWWYSPDHDYITDFRYCDGMTVFSDGSVVYPDGFTA